MKVWGRVRNFWTRALILAVALPAAAQADVQKFTREGEAPFLKRVAALLIGRAIKLGYIKSLDQLVADFITEWKGDASREKMKIGHLLDMRSDLLMQGQPTGPQDIFNRAYLHPRHDEIVIRDYPLINEPAMRYDYSNATSELIAPIIERSSYAIIGLVVAAMMLIALLFANYSTAPVRFTAQGTAKPGVLGMVAMIILSGYKLRQEDIEETAS
jgi:hypothetical protein